jgi:hypothetical protein
MKIRFLGLLIPEFGKEIIFFAVDAGKGWKGRKVRRFKTAIPSLSSFPLIEVININAVWKLAVINRKSV